jgi:hypothetical protein
MGRQFKPSQFRRTERIELRLSKAEAHEVFTRSIKAGLSVSDFIRKSALGADAFMVRAEPERATLINQLNELHNIGQALGQLVRSGIYNTNPDKAALLAETLLEIKTLSAHLIKKLDHDLNRKDAW